MAKFLDVTRSDLLFADKVILVESIAEKLLLPMFMDKCGYAYEDELFLANMAEDSAGFVVAA